MPKDDKGWQQLEEIFKNITVQDVGKIVLRLHGRIQKRAFPLKGRARGSDGRGMPNLSQPYKDYKAGRIAYKTEITKKRAMARRRNTGGSPIKGPRSEGRRLGPRSPLPNNQLSGKTAQNFQARAIDKNTGKIFFSGRGEIGGRLEDRKPWIRPTNEEFGKAQTDLSHVVNEYVKDLPKDLITFDLGTMTLGK
jgi:hypothetical protein